MYRTTVSVLRTAQNAMPRPTEVEIVPYRDGPYLVRGPVIVRDQDGGEVPVTRRPVALCRCGKSRMRPFCDGTHQLIRFQAPSEPERPFPAADPVPPRPRRAAGPALESDGRGAPGRGAPAPDGVRAAAALVGNALHLLTRAVPDPAREDDLRGAVAALREAARELEERL
jgi:CDGSH-type Zn-finger protein